MRSTLESPVGMLTLVANERALIAVLWPDDSPRRVRLEEAREDTENAILQETSSQLREYFAGARRSFDLPLTVQGTAFQKQVWEQLLLIPYGETRSYGELASRMGRPSSSRAVGAAIGRNPLSMIVPCHRVIGIFLQHLCEAGSVRQLVHALPEAERVR